MSDVAATLEKTDWVEELQKKVFEECVAQAQNEPEPVLSYVSSSTAPEKLGDVPVWVIVSNINQNFAQVPHFRKRTDFLEELRRSLDKVARADRVNWCEFRDSSAHWFLSLLNLVRQDGNNNISVTRSDDPTEDSERDGLSLEEHSDAIDIDINTCSINHPDTIASCYSLNNSSMGVGTTDSMMESSEEIDHARDDVAGIDLNVRIRRFNEETSDLRNELLRAEETIAAFDRDAKLTQKALEQTTDKYTRLRKENEDQTEMLAAAEQREEMCKLDLRKLEKICSLLQKRVEELEVQEETISSLKAKISEISKENSAFTKQIAEYKIKYNEKCFECEYLQEKNSELQNNICQLEKSYGKNLQDFQEKIQELQIHNAELQSKMNKSDSSSRFSLTPPPYNYANANIHSTPYNNQKIQHQDSLFSELKASGFNIDDAKVQDLKEELSFYNEEIAIITEQVDDALQDIAASRNEICAPSVQLVEKDSIETLKHKIATLLNLVKTCTAVKSPPAPRIEEDHRREKPDILPETTKTGCLVNDRLLASESRENDLIGSVTSSMTSVPEKRVCDKSTSPLPEATGFLADISGDSETHDTEQEIIVPIVEALNRIIEIKGAEDEENFGTIGRLGRNPRHKSIFTTTRSSNWCNARTETTKPKDLVSSKNTQKYFNSKVDSHASGDGPQNDFVNAKNSTGLEHHIGTTTAMKTLKSEFKDYNSSQEETVKKLDTRFVTIRPTEKTYVLSPAIVSSTEKSEVELLPTKVDDTKSEVTYFPTPIQSPKQIPRRKLSVYHRSFDVDTLQTPDSAQSTSNEKRRSISTPDVQETEYVGYRAKTFQPLESPITRNQLLTTYRCANNSDSSCSPSPKKDDPLARKIDDESPTCEVKREPVRTTKQVIIAPTKFRLPDSTVNQTPTIDKEIITKSKPIAAQGIFQKNSSCEKISENEPAEHLKILSSSVIREKKEESNKTAQQSRILSSSSNLAKKGNDNNAVQQSRILSSTVNLIKKDDSNSAAQQSKILGSSTSLVKKGNNITSQQSKILSLTANLVEKQSNNTPQESMILSSSASLMKKEENNPKNDTLLTNTLDSDNVGSSMLSCSSSKTSTIDILSSNNSTDCLDISDSVFLPSTGRKDQTYTKKGVEESRKVTATTAPTVTAATVTTAAVAASAATTAGTAAASNETSLRCSSVGGASGGVDVVNDEPSGRAPAVVRAMSSGEGSSAESECDPRTSAEKTGAGDEQKPAPPSSLPPSLDCSVVEVDSSGKPILGRRRSNSCAEDKRRWCKDNVGLQKDKVETSPTVNGDDKENSCQKVTSNSSPQEVIKEDESPRAFPSWTDEKLQESGIASFPDVDSEMSENLSEEELKKKYTAFSVGLSTDRMTLSKRVILSRRHRDQAEKNFTNEVLKMQQDVKELPRQRNSVSGRVPGLRRPSLCYETPKWEVEKLDRTDSSSSITELREIFEQAESRRHSREENNNLVRTSINNLSTITSEHREEEEIWSNTREDIVPELANNNEINSLEVGQHYRHPLICWLLNRYTTWKSMIWGIFIAFLLGFFVNRVVSSSTRHGPPLSWWSIEEILNQYIQVENEKHPLPRPI